MLKKLFCEILNWHKCDHSQNLEHDGTSFIGRCKRCKCRLMKNPKGDWYRAYYQAIILLLLLVSRPCFAEPSFTEANIIKALAGEAGGQSDAELMAHAHAIRNRGHLGGVYGISRPVGQSTLKRARNAWNRACREADRLNGCDHWLSVYDLKHSRESLIAWRHKAVYKVLVGETWFYKLGEGAK